MKNRSEVERAIDKRMGIKEEADPSGSVPVRVGDTVVTPRGEAKVTGITIMVPTPDGEKELVSDSCFVDQQAAEITLDNGHWAHNWQISSINGEPVR